MLMSGLPKKEKVIALLKSIETGDPTPANSYIRKDSYKQHNLSIPDGFEGFAGMLNSLSPGETKVNIVRAFIDGDYVFTHTEYTLAGHKVGFDIFKFKDEKIVEHWDNLQDFAENSVSGRSQVDGPTTAVDVEKTSENKALVQGFVDDVLLGKNSGKLKDYVVLENYLQHNPDIADGFSSVIKTLERFAAEGTPLVYKRHHMLLGEGNFVLSVSDGEFLNKSASFYDLFRVEDGKIVEHWDTIEMMPNKTEWKHSNGKY